MKTGGLARLVSAAVVAVMASHSAASQDAGGAKLRPADFWQRVASADPETVAPFVVVTADLRAMREVQALVATGTHLRADTLPLVPGVAVVAPLRVAHTVAALGAVVQVWLYTGPAFDRAVRVIDALQYVVVNVPGVSPVNMSYGPSADEGVWLADPGEPVQRAIVGAIAHGKVLVVAVGNQGPLRGRGNPWCRAAAVICVGASDASGTRVAPFSTRGPRDGTGIQPTVVASGIDVLTTHPTGAPKSQQNLSDERRVGFDTLVPPEKRAAYTIVSGTSFAAPQVSAVVAQLLHYWSGLEEERARDGAAGGTVEVTYARRAGQSDPRVVGAARLVGQFHQTATETIVTYPAALTPLLVRQLVMDLALPIPGADPTVAGAGFVSFDLALKQFGRFGRASVQLLPLKVTDGVGERPPTR